VRIFATIHESKVMSQRITRAFLDAKADTLNSLTNSPAESSRMVDGKYRANVGSYHISGSYGGYCLHRMANEAGGVNDVLNCGHITAKQLAALMSAYTAGLYDATKINF
jgi:hypothetical protein